jgi:FAD:protein FMN transferase
MRANMRLLLTALFAFMPFMFFVGGCERLGGSTHPLVIHKTQGNVFGTTVEVSIYGESDADAERLGGEVMKEFERLHNKFHAWQPSALTALNDAIARGETWQADTEMIDILKSATKLAVESDHTFNPAIGHLIRLWGFQSSDIEAHGPSGAEVKQWVDANPRMTDLVFDGTRISSRNRAVMLDLGGYAKGYALDRAARILRAQHVKAALVNVGGNILAIGRPGERSWRVGIQDPRGDGTIANIDLHDNEAIGTSGDYQRYFMKDGKRHPHIIDPRTGETTDLVASVTIITSGGEDAGTRSDGNTKPLFIVGPKGWRGMADHLGLKDAMLIDANRNIELTPTMRDRMGASQSAGHG